MQNEEDFFLVVAFSWYCKSHTTSSWYFVSLTYNQDASGNMPGSTTTSGRSGNVPISSGSSTFSELPGWNGGASGEPSIVSGSGSLRRTDQLSDEKNAWPATFYTKPASCRASNPSNVLAA